MTNIDVPAAADHAYSTVDDCDLLDCAGAAALWSGAQDDRQAVRDLAARLAGLDPFVLESIPELGLTGHNAHRMRVVRDAFLIGDRWASLVDDGAELLYTGTVGLEAVRAHLDRLLDRPDGRTRLRTSRVRADGREGRLGAEAP